MYAVILDCKAPKYTADSIIIMFIVLGHRESFKNMGTEAFYWSLTATIAANVLYLLIFSKMVSTIAVGKSFTLKYNLRHLGISWSTLHFYFRP